MKHVEALQAYNEKNFTKAYGIWEEESQNDNDQAMTNIGLMYLNGNGLEKDFIKAKEWFIKASAYDNDSANYNLALMYQTKLIEQEDDEKILYYFRKAASKNHKGANFRLGHLLLKDRTKKELLKEGFECILRAAKKNHPVAISMMGGLDIPAEEKETSNLKFRQLSLEKQLELINETINTNIKPMLASDGGDIILIEYTNNPKIEIRLAYQGACTGCSFASTSTYDFIRQILSKTIDENILVYVL